MLPQHKTPPRVDLSDQTILIYGPPKIGKSSFASAAEDALFLATEAGLNHLNVYQVPIASWNDLLVVCKEVAEGKHSFRSIVLDTIDNAYRFCAAYVCEQNGIKHESDMPYGKAYALINNEFQRVLTKLSLLPQGLILISHAQTKELDARTGKFTRHEPSLPDKIKRIILAMCDLILFFDTEDSTDANGALIQQRVIRTKPTKHYEAGDRSGRLPETIEMDFHKFLEAYRATASQSTTQAPSKTPTPANNPKDRRAEK